MKIIIRKAKPGDSKGVAEVMNYGLRTGFNFYTGTKDLRDKNWIRKAEEVYGKNKKNLIILVAVDNNSKMIVGSCSFDAKEKGRSRHRGEIGWVVHQNYVRKGIGTKLLKALLSQAKKNGFKKVQAEAAVENISSIKLAKKLGFDIEGRIKAGLLLDDGRYVDSYLFGKVLK